jgi:hypothetical protein
MDAPALSVVIGPRKLKSIIQPPAEIVSTPFNPFDSQPPLHLERYGIDFSEYLKAVWPNPAADRSPTIKP